MHQQMRFGDFFFSVFWGGFPVPCMKPTCCCLGHVATDGPVPARNGMGNVMGGPVKCSSEGKAVELSKSMVEQLVMSEKEGKREISDR